MNVGKKSAGKIIPIIDFLKNQVMGIKENQY
ncbi:MAG: hypothetical protein Ct9H300mP5_0020 [Candidatus Pelagibacterales bacterium]|nr:MAG: hypothetical protein Ct9H300mP5_0020 [Pelagibacterales bacterium]